MCGYLQSFDVDSSSISIPPEMAPVKAGAMTIAVIERDAVPLVQNNGIQPDRFSIFRDISSALRISITGPGINK